MHERTEIDARPRGGPRRCAYCHDDLAASEEEACPGCGALLHGECRDALSRCPTIGCGVPLRPAPADRHAAPVPDPEAARQAVRLPALVLQVNGALSALQVGLATLAFAPGWSRPGVVTTFTYLLVSAALGVLQLVGGHRLRQLRSRSLVVWAAVLGALPLVSPCCLTGIAAAWLIWRALDDPAVRRAYWDRSRQG